MGKNKEGSHVQDLSKDFRKSWSNSRVLHSAICLQEVYYILWLSFCWLDGLQMIRYCGNYNEIMGESVSCLDLHGQLFHSFLNENMRKKMQKLFRVNEFYQLQLPFLFNHFLEFIVTYFTILAHFQKLLKFSKWYFSEKKKLDYRSHHKRRNKELITFNWL